jgi:hypothetical protein
MMADLPQRVLKLIVNPEPIKPSLEENPDAMRSLVATGKARGYSTEAIADLLDRRIKKYLATVGNRSQGERNATAYRVARWLVSDFGASDTVAWAYLSEWNAGNSPPLSERELSLTMRSAKRSGRRPAGCAHSRGSAA